MFSSSYPEAELLTALREKLGALAPEPGYRACMEAAAKLIEEAAYLIAPEVPKSRIVELLLLASEIENIGYDSTLIETSQVAANGR